MICPGDWDKTERKGKHMNKEMAMEILNNMNQNLLIELFQEANYVNGSFEFADTHSLEEVCEIMDAYEIAKAIIYGEVDDVNIPVYFDDYGYLRSIDEHELYSACMDNLSEMILWLEEDHDKIDLTKYNLQECFEKMSR